MSSRGRGRGRWRGRGGGGGRQRSGRGRGNRNYSQDAKQDLTTIEEFGLASPSADSIAIAIEGCCHGALDTIYERLQNHEKVSGRKIDLLLCCGDFQSLRNTADFHSFAVPPKYHDLGGFYKYYTGEKVAPVTTIFIGGNHEASQPLQELYYGGWVAPNIYYLGAAGVVKYRGLRIGGMSGIYKKYDFTQSRFERPPYDRSTMRSVYHYRNTEVFRLSCLRPGKLDIMLSHDWPQGIEQHGDTRELIRRKPFFKEEIAKNELGSPPAMSLLQRLQPKHWFSAHLHVKFSASVSHPSSGRAAQGEKPPSLVPSQVMASPSAIPPSGKTEFLAPDSASCPSSTGKDLTALMTQFLSLDKCLPRRQYLSIFHVVPTEDNEGLSYDPEWLAILRKTHELSRSSRKQRVHVPTELQTVVETEMEWIRDRFGDSCKIPTVFEPNVVVRPGGPSSLLPALPFMGNPQTDQFLQRLGLEHLPNLTTPFTGVFEFGPPRPVVPACSEDENEIDLDDDDEGEIGPGSKRARLEEDSPSEEGPKLSE